MTIMGMYGNVGYGKQVFVVNYAGFLKRLNQKKKQKVKFRVRANFHITGLDYADYMTIDQFIDLKLEENIHTLCLIDEPYAWGLESRRSGSDIAVAMTQKSSQSRHYGIDIFYTTQLPSQMDKRLRFLARGIFLAIPPDDFGFHYIYMGKRYKLLHIPLETARKDVWPHYDTYETIQPEFSPEYLKRMNEEEIERAEGQGYTPRKLSPGEQIMVTRDGLKLYRSLTNPENWDEELKNGGKVISDGAAS